MTYGTVVTISKIVTSLALFLGAAYVLPKIFAFLKGNDKKDDKSKDEKNEEKKNHDAQAPGKPTERNGFVHSKVVLPEVRNQSFYGMG